MHETSASNTTGITGTERTDLSTPGGFADLDASALTRQTVAANEVYAQALRAYDDACQSLGTVLTEQIARDVLTRAAGAAMLVVRPASEYHRDASGALDDLCPGHEERLVPADVLDGAGASLGALDVLSPTYFWLERLTALMGLHDAFLDLATRTWTFPEVDDLPW